MHSYDVDMMVLIRTGCQPIPQHPIDSDLAHVRMQHIDRIRHEALVGRAFDAVHDLVIIVGSKDESP